MFFKAETANTNLAVVRNVETKEPGDAETGKSNVEKPAGGKVIVGVRDHAISDRGTTREWGRYFAADQSKESAGEERNR